MKKFSVTTHPPTGLPTGFSPAMLVEGATAHIRVIELHEALALVDENTKISASRISHEQLAHHTFPGASSTVARYAMLKPGTNALLLHCRGPPVPESDEFPAGGTVTSYLIEAEEY